MVYTNDQATNTIKYSVTIDTKSHPLSRIRCYGVEMHTYTLITLSIALIPALALALIHYLKL